MTDHSPFNSKRRLALPAALLLAIAVFALCAIQARRPEPFTVSFLDVGQGDAALISAGENQVLVDAGPDSSVLSGLGAAMPFFDRTIELAVLTHPHADHYTGFLAVLRRYRIRTMILPEYAAQSPDYRRLLEAVRDDGTAVTLLDCGEKAAVGGMTLHVLRPCRGHAQSADPNEESLVLRVSGPDGGTVLLTGDLPGASGEVEAAAAPGEWQAELLKVPHHGSRTGATAAFLKLVQPTAAVISVGKRNTYGHPSPAVLERLDSLGIRIWRTDRDGTVTAVWGPGGFRVSTTVKPPQTSAARLPFQHQSDNFRSSFAKERQ